MTMKTMMTMMSLRTVLMCLVLCLVSGTSIPMDKKSRVVVSEPLSQQEHDDTKNHNFDHEAFLGVSESKAFDQLPPEESRRRLGIIVDKIDTNNDGFVTEDELQKWIKTSQDKHVEESVQRQWDEFDLDRDGLISWDEYKNVTYGTYLEDPDSHPEYNYKQMMQRDERRFKVADTDGNLRADKKEFAAFLHPEDHEHMKDIVVKETIEDIDKNGDGEIDLKEYIGDMYSPEEGEAEPEWVASEREQFVDFRDKNKDGKMDKQETLEWILPSDYDHVLAEAKHLLNETDTNKDGKLTKQEILDKSDVFVGSQVTEYGEALLRHDEF